MVVQVQSHPVLFLVAIKIYLWRFITQKFIMRFNILPVLFLLPVLSAHGQFGGNTSYDFLNLSTQARVNALGSNQVGLVDSLETGLSFYNPATLRPSMHNYLSVSYINYIKDINYGNATYVRHFGKIGTFGAAMHYINYGKFIEADESGQITGKFSAGDYALNLMWAKNIWGPITIGANLKPIFSTYEAYNSFGLAADLGVSYTDSTGLFSAGLALKNMGMQITTYDRQGEREPLPFDLQVGFSQKLAHAPLRLCFTFQRLLDWNLTDKSTWDYDQKDEDDYVAGNSDTFLRQFMRHMIIGAEFVPSQNFSLSLGYNYQRRRELGVTSNLSFVGLSGGFNVKINKFRLSYAISSYHLAGASNTFSISTRLSEFL